MSKSMWIDALSCKPVLREDGKFTIPVLVWEFSDNAPKWGHYDPSSREWHVKFGAELDRIPEGAIQYFAYIDNPYK